MSDQEQRRPQQHRRKSQNRKRRKQGKPVDLWRPVPELDEPKPIRPASDPTALLRSLGDPPLQGQGAVAEHYVAAVVERAAGVATALAAAAGLLGSDAEEQTGD
jgi:hypothetical protein